MAKIWSEMINKTGKIFLYLLKLNQEQYEEKVIIIIILGMENGRLGN